MTKTVEDDEVHSIGRKHRIFTNPAPNYRASICTWSLQFKFETREQCTSFMFELLETSDIPWNINYEEQEGNNHIVSIDEMSWAKNLTLVSEILERVDYKG